MVEKYPKERILMFNKKKTGISIVEDIRLIAVHNVILKIIEMNVSQEIKEIASIFQSKEVM